MENKSLNKNLVEQSLSFHGLPLIKTWTDECGFNSLINLGIQPNAIDTTLYHERLKSLNYNDRTKRMRLHQFICKKSDELFKNVKIDPAEKTIQKLLVGGGESFPPLEYFSNFNADERTSKFFMSLRPGDVVYGVVLQPIKLGLLIKIFCSTGGVSSIVTDLNIKGVVPMQHLIPAIDSKSASREFLSNDLVCCEVLEITDQIPQIVLGMTSIHRRFDSGPPLGLIRMKELPQFYQIAFDPQNQGKSYNQLLRDLETFKNPSSIDNLYLILGLKPSTHYSLMSKNKFSQEEYAKDLRQQQAGKLAFRCVAEGIGHFKEGRHEEAFQCLNKALSIDPRNVEGLVARGALNANSSRFQKAIVDFEAALKIQPNHNNAKKYLGETLLALGRSFEEENKFEEAQKTYIHCLNINPQHQEALASLNYIKDKLSSRKIVEPAELELPPLNIGSIPMKEPKIKEETRSKKTKKDKKKKGKKRHSSSSESSSETSDSSESSSESSDNSSSSSNSDSRSKKKNKKRKSPSPLSKRIEIPESINKYVGQYGSSSNFDPMDDHELKVKKFLEMSRDEDDYEEKVGQLIAEASKYQKTKQAEEAKSAKKKKKMEKKMKKDKKKRKKEEKKKLKDIDIDKLRETLKMFDKIENLPDKFKKLVHEKLKDEEKHGEGSSANDEKWKMKFSKTEGDTKPKKAANNFSLYDSDEEDDIRNFQSTAPTIQSSTTSVHTTVSKTAASPVKEVVLPVLTPVLPATGPIVLDKFGNFRRLDPQPVVPVQNPAGESRRSRSKGRRGSRSRSNSRSPRRRRSRSWRRYSRSRSRSHSRSPGRSGRGFRRGHNDMRPRARVPYSPRGSRGSSRGSWNDRFRDNRDFRSRDNRFDRDRRGRGGRYNSYNRRSDSGSPGGSPRRRSLSDKIDGPIS